MTFALCLQVPNHLRFKRKLDIYTNFIPQILFLQSIFGYLVVCILYKWSIDWSKATTEPPSLLNMLISMFLEPGHVNPKLQLYRGQATVQIILLLLAAVCIPWLLLTKPYLLWKEMHKSQGQGYMSLGNTSATDDVPTRLSGIGLDDEEEGNGQAPPQAAEEEVHALPLIFSRGVLINDCSRGITILERLLFIRSFIPLSSVWDVYPIRHLTSVYGRYHLHMRSYRRSSGP